MTFVLISNAINHVSCHCVRVGVGVGVCVRVGVWHVAHYLTTLRIRQVCRPKSFSLYKVNHKLSKPQAKLLVASSPLPPTYPYLSPSPAHTQMLLMKQKF